MSAQNMNNGSGKDWSEDPRLTAYAFGELEGGDTEEMEALCAREPSAQAYVDEMRALGGELESQFGSEVELALSGEQRAAIEAEMDVPAQAPKRGRLLHMSRYALVGSAAALLVAAVFVIKQSESEFGRSAVHSDAVAKVENRDVRESRVSTHEELERLGYRGGSNALDSLGYQGDSGTDQPASRAPAPDGELARRREQKLLSQMGYAGGDGEDAKASANAVSPEMAEMLHDLGYVGDDSDDALASNPRLSQEALKELSKLGYVDPKGFGAGTGSPTYKDGAANPVPASELAALESLGYSAGPSSPGPSGSRSAPTRSRESDRAKRKKPSGRTALRGLGYTGLEARDGPYDSGRQTEVLSGEKYKYLSENPFKLVGAEPLSTFSVDVDTASYANARDLLNRGNLPPAAAVRVEEFINYFRYDYGAPKGSDPFNVNVEVGSTPWVPQNRLMRVGLQAKETLPEERKASNLVFLLDVSGSMNSSEKLPLLQSALHMLVQELDERDSVAIVVYAGASGLVLPSTHCHLSAKIHAAIDSLRSGGSTNGAAGIQLAYSVAARNFIPGGINRVILGTDGDFNVGVSDEGGLERLIVEKAKTGVFLSVLGFGRGNLQDVTMETLADKGNGNYSYIDSVLEARKVLVQELGSTLEVVAKDVKLQVEFNPALVQAYRLIGYENRMLAAQDFNDDKKDAGEIGAGHRVTALYEIVPVGAPMPRPGVDALRYQTPEEPTGAATSGELCWVKVRYKRPEGDTSIRMVRPVLDSRVDFHELSASTRWATSVASFALLLKGSSTIRETSAADIIRWATQSVVEDSDGYCRQFIYLVGRYEELKGR